MNSDLHQITLHYILGYPTMWASLVFRFWRFLRISHYVLSRPNDLPPPPKTVGFMYSLWGSHMPNMGTAEVTYLDIWYLLALVSHTHIFTLQLDYIGLILACQWQVTKIDCPQWFLLYTLLEYVWWEYLPQKVMLTMTIIILPAGTVWCVNLPQKNTAHNDHYYIPCWIIYGKKICHKHYCPQWPLIWNGNVTQFIIRWKKSKKEPTRLPTSKLIHVMYGSISCIQGFYG